MKPQNDYVLVKINAIPEKTEAGIITLEHRYNTDNKMFTGVVKAVGPGRINKKGRRVKPDFKRGQTVLFSKYSGYEINEGEVFLKAEQIEAVLES